MWFHSKGQEYQKASHPFSIDWLTVLSFNNKSALFFSIRPGLPEKGRVTKGLRTKRALLSSNNLIWLDAARNLIMLIEKRTLFEAATSLSSSFSNDCIHSAEDTFLGLVSSHRFVWLHYTSSSSSSPFSGVNIPLGLDCWIRIQKHCGL